MIDLRRLIILSLTILVCDALFLNMVMVERYRKIFGELKFDIYAAIFTYGLMVFGLYYFVLNTSVSKLDALKNGLIFGFVLYGVYDGTLLSFLSNKDYKTGAIDIIYGTILCGLGSYLAY